MRSVPILPEPKIATAIFSITFLALRSSERLSGNVKRFRIYAFTSVHLCPLMPSQRWVQWPLCHGHTHQTAIERLVGEHLGRHFSHRAGQYYPAAQLDVA